MNASRGRGGPRRANVERKLSRVRAPRSVRNRAQGLWLEQLEPRWTPTWGPIPPAAISILPNIPSVALNAQGDASGTAAISAYEVDYLRFTATLSGTYLIAAGSPASNLDTVLGLYSSSGMRLASNDDAGFGTTDSLVAVNLTAGTQYLLGVSNYDSSTLGSYSWAIDGPAAVVADDAYENNETLATAYNLGTLTSATTLNGLVLADASDVFRFDTTSTGAAGNVVSISTDNTQGNLQLDLYDSLGRTIARSYHTGSSESISLAGMAAGTYYVRISGSLTAQDWTYRLSLSPPAAAPPTSPGTAFPDVAYYGGSTDWNVNAINAPEAWAQGYRGQDVVVAVIDTGVDINHPELMSQIWVNSGEIAGNRIDDDGNGFVDDVNGWDFIGNDSNPSDVHGHGTHVAGTIAAAANGVGATGIAPGATIMPVRVLGDDGSGSTLGVANGIRYAARMGADIINLSLGGGLSSALQSAIQYAQQLGVLIVAAAGNESAATPGYPARFSSTFTNVLSVGAYTSSGAIASFSNDVGTSGAVQVDAPGSSIYSTYVGSRYTTMSGTSMATPHVAGLAALAWSANHNLTAAQVRSIIVAGANRAIAGSDGRGGINAALTVALAASGQLSSSAATAAPLAARSTVQVSLRQFLSLRSVEPDGPSLMLGSNVVAESAQQDVSSRATSLDLALTEFDSIRERDAIALDDTISLDADTSVSEELWEDQDVDWYLGMLCETDGLIDALRVS